MMLFLKILLAHLIGDFVLQPDSWVKSKNHKKYWSPKLYLHVLVHAIILALMLGFDTRYWIGYVVIVLSHFLIDVLKIWSQRFRPRSRFMFLVDQVLHILVIILVVSFYETISLSFTGLLTYERLLLITSLVVVTFVAGVVVKVFIARWNPDIIGDKDLTKDKAGYIIGILERFLVFVFVLLGRWEAIGFLIAAKSVFRFGDLKEPRERMLTEYILIGTLASFGVAILIGLAYQHLANLPV
ncbi:MAG: DUF3307 domain-containing protein [Bacteroidetes bacterium]|nr:MAG: DUF3307 domain-containing protein [Bacteroidota bacterium]